MTKLPTISSAPFSWTGKHGRCTLEEIGVNQFFPRGFYMRSTRTGQTQLFLPDSVKMEQNDFYDGEGYDYFAPGGEMTIHIRA